MPNVSYELKFEDEVYLLYKNLSNPNIFGVNCGDFQECISESLNHTNQAIICSSYEGCFDGSATLKLNETYVVNDNHIGPDVKLLGIYCGGDRGCKSTKPFRILIGSGSSADLESLDINLFDIHCDGSNSCEQASLSGPNNLFCGGNQACNSSTISSMETIYGTGYESLHSASIFGTIGDIYCISAYSCESGIIENTGGAIYGFGTASMRNCTISNHNSTNTLAIEDIYTIGYQAGYGTIVNNVKPMYASGYQVLVNSVITGIRNLYVSGINTLSGSSITTAVTINDSSIGSSVVLDIGGTNDVAYNVLCSSGDHCGIYCGSNTSCSTMLPGLCKLYNIINQQRYCY